MNIASLGIETLDSEHAEIAELNMMLFNAINGRIAAIDTFEVTGRLYKMAMTHFRNEEALFAGWDGAVRHTHLHSEMVRQLNKIFAEFDSLSPEYTPAVQKAHLSELSKFVSDWFHNHIAYEDTKYIEYVRTRSPKM